MLQWCRSFMTPENRIGNIDPSRVAAASNGEPILDVGNDRQRLVLDRLQQGIEAATTEPGFRSWRRVVSRFHEYSLANTLLIAAQNPDATKVAGYRKWQEMGRQVRKGEKAIKIF